MDVARHHFLTGAAFTGDQDGSIGSGDTVSQLDDCLHGRVAGNHRAFVVGDRFQDGGDQVGIRRHRDEFLGAGADGRSRRFRAHIDAAGHNRNRDPLGLIGRDQGLDVQMQVHHEQVGAPAGPQMRCGLFDRVDLGDFRSAVQGDLGGGMKLSAQGAYNQNSHGFAPSLPGTQAESPSLMISVMVTPSRSSTTTTSPRATRRLLT